VSIKKKFATTVATASLLAGIFGSAFVPSALAARETAALADIKPRYSVLTAGASVLANDDEDAFAIKSSVSNETLAAVGATLSVTLFSAGSAGEGTTIVPTADIKVTSSSSSLLVSIMDDGDVCTDNDDAANLFAQSDTFLDAVEHTEDDGDYVVCLAGATATSSVKDATVTISARRTDSSGAYTVIDTVKVSVLGAVASLNLAIAGGYKYVAIENEPVADWFTIKGFDAAGNLLNGGDGTVTEGESLPAAPANWEDNPENGDETVVSPLDEIEAVNDADATAGGTELTAYGLETDACVTIDDDEATSDIGRSYSVKVQDGTDADVVSNAVVITCTGSDARISKISASDSAGPQLYDDGTGDDGDLEIIATFVDEGGRPLGDGLAASNFGALTFDGAAALVAGLEANDINTAAIAAGAIVGGEIVLASFADGFDFTRRGKFTYTVEVAAPDLGDADEDELTATLTYVATGSDDVTISATRNAAKTRATISADMGEDNAYSRVEFIVELANGNVKTYTRRANDAGVAVLTQSRRNTTIYVYADLTGDDAGSPTDVLAVKFK
jgi:hypothetical protein